MRLLEKVLAGALVMLASSLASAGGVGWLDKGAAGTLVAAGRSTAGATLFVCRAATADGAVVLGKVAMTGDRAGECQVALDGREQVLTEFQLLAETPETGGFYKWLPGHATSYPQHSVVAGEAEDGRRWLVCAGLHAPDGSVQPGYIEDENCVYSHAGRQWSAETYLVLASNAPEAATTEEAQPSAGGFDPGAILAEQAVARFCALAAGTCAPALPPRSAPVTD